ncbi:hypothetical protein PCE31106_04686 [Pandoraea cepalis]|uniref:Uncharacterized protein n=1 Tax=Pandoraea cepalis TaxID=2508294 RepID=A0A5E4YRH2_9BURK|nr:hypothetical protein [Pandoraea cepalis]VVE51396.1 hypothetical protein PCE31106_04686 [Pandoraea cepalis]
MINPRPFVRVFTPELWGQVDKFKQFYASTHNFKPDAKKAVAGVDNHFQKAVTLRRVASKLASNLRLDNDELAQKGYTAALNSQEFSAVVEEVFTELYSSIDCARKVIVAIYGNCRHVPDSTHKLFVRAAKGEIGSDFPKELLMCLQSATWFPELLLIRDELTHATIGACHQDADSDKITYIHHGIRQNKRSLVIDDVFAKADEFFDAINRFLGQVFFFLNAGLTSTPVDVVCAFAFDRVYARKLKIAETIDLNSGTCTSFQWFDSQPERRCLLADECGAYRHAKESGPSSGL